MPRSGPVIVQSDGIILLEVDHPDFEAARDQLSGFADLIKSPEHIHTYRLTHLSLWNAASSGLSSEDVVAILDRYSRYDLPQNVVAEIREYMSRYGRVRLVRRDGGLFLESTDPIAIAEIAHAKPVQAYLLKQPDANTLQIDPARRGHVKQVLLRLGYPVKDLAGYVQGTPLAIRLRDQTLDKRPFVLREYQIESIRCFYRDGDIDGGSGVLVLPCGAGKTVIGLGVMAALQCETLILCTNIVALRQWRDEILDKTTLRREQIGEYSGEAKEIRPVTLATYQIVTYRPSKDGDFPHFGLFNAHDWGLIIYDEVHLLPAPVFRITAEIQARRRLGLTATLVREDGHEDDVFSLIGPKRYDVPWKKLEYQGWIAPVDCYEIRLPIPGHMRLRYATVSLRNKYRVAAENPEKLRVAERIIGMHKDDSVLVIGQYLTQLDELARHLKAPLITGKTSNTEREVLYERFRNGEIPVLVVSKVANFAIDLPDANVAIQVSGTFGSRQEEAQRLGRILRPKSDGGQAYFYSLVTRESRDQEFSAKRQLFLTEQGYRYHIGDESLLDQVRTTSSAV